MANGSQNNVSYQAQKWTNLRTFTIGETGKDVDGTTNISWSKDEILGASDSSKFLRGDKTWSDTLIGPLYINYEQDVGKNQNGSLIIGNKTGENIGIDSNEIMARNNSAVSTLYLNNEGGTVQIGGPLNVSNTITASSTIQTTNGYLKSTINGNTVTIGSQNTGCCHITNSADIPFWFNKNILIETGKTIGAADSVYRPFKIFLGRHTTSGSNALNAGSPLIEFSNGNRSQYCQLIYDDYDSLVSPDSLTLVGNQNGIHFILKNGPLWVQGGSNAGGNVNRLTTSSGMPGNMQYNQSRRGTQIYANGIAFADPYNGNSNNDAGWIRHQETTVNAGELEIAVGDDGDETIVVRQYNTSNGIKRTLTLLSKDGYTFLPSYLNLGGGHEKNASSPSYVWGSNSSDTYLRSYQTGYLNVNSAGYLRDRTNGTASYLNYGASGLAGSSISWMCCWNGYEARAISKAETFNVVRDNGGDSRWAKVASDNNFVAHGNESNFLSSGYSGELYINYRTTGGTNGKVTWYRFHNGGGGTYAGIRCGDIEASYLTVRAQGGNEGGEINLAAPPNYSSRNATMDVYQNDWRIHSSGTVRFWVNLAQGTHSDYAEGRAAASNEPGRVYIETNECILKKAQQRLLPGCSICSDTYGAVVPGEPGEPLFAVAGRALVYPYQPRENYQAGMAVCSAPNGTVDIMTREEIREYPDCIIGYVAGIPSPDTWPEDNVPLDGRIWIRLA